jgi:hypothetical protein
MPVYAGSGQNNGNTTKLRNRICVGYTERIQVGNIQCYSSFCLPSVVLVSVIVLSDSPCERIGKSNIYPVLKADRSLVRV